MKLLSILTLAILTSFTLASQCDKREKAACTKRCDCTQNECAESSSFCGKDECDCDKKRQ